MESRDSVLKFVADLRSDRTAVRNTAAKEIWDRYMAKLLELARDHLDRRIRRRVDEEDVLQSMYKSFCSRQRRGEYDLTDRDSLWGLLATITLNKVRNAARDETRQLRDIGREQGIPTGDEAASARWTLEQMAIGDPSPLEAAVLNEELERRLHALQDTELRQIAVWKMEGRKNEEIAERLDLAERTIERRLDRIRRKWISLDGGAQ